MDERQSAREFMPEMSRTLQAHIPDRFVWPARTVVLLFAMIFLHDIWVALNDGEIVSHRRLLTPDDGSNFNSAIWKKAAYALFFIFVAFGAIRGEIRLHRDIPSDRSHRKENEDPHK